MNANRPKPRKPRPKPRVQKPKVQNGYGNYATPSFSDTCFHSRITTKNKPLPGSSAPHSSRQTLQEKVDPWDASNQAHMTQLEAQVADPEALYRQFQTLRESERREMESRGLVDRQDTRKTLDEALSFVGSCKEMCPVFERVRRRLEHSIKAYERDNNGSITRAVKAFSRPAAGQPPPLPSDVRPPSVLQRTLEYLVGFIVPQLPEAHSFLWDRTRSIRQDFTYQNYAGPEAVFCNEVIARIHVYCLHIMAGEPEFSRQQELEQFNKTLQTLGEFYGAHPNRKLADFPFEPEMRAFQLLSHLKDPDIAAKIEALPQHVRCSGLVVLAQDLRRCVAGLAPTSLFARFFKKLHDAPVLVQCLLEVHMVDIRLAAIRAINRSLHNKNGLYPLHRLTCMLGFESERETSEFCVHYKLVVSNNEVDLKSWNESTVAERSPIRQPKLGVVSERLSVDVLTGEAQPARSQPQPRPTIPRTVISRPTLPPQSARPRPQLQPALPAQPIFQPAQRVQPIQAQPAPAQPQVPAIPQPAPAPAEPAPAPAPAPQLEPSPSKPKPYSQQDILNVSNALIQTEVRIVVRKAIQTAKLELKKAAAEKAIKRKNYISSVANAVLSTILRSLSREAVLENSAKYIDERRRKRMILSALKTLQQQKRVDRSKQFDAALGRFNSCAKARVRGYIQYSSPDLELNGKPQPKVEPPHAPTEQLKAAKKRRCHSGELDSPYLCNRKSPQQVKPRPRSVSLKIPASIVALQRATQAAKELLRED